MIKPLQKRYIFVISLWILTAISIGFVILFFFKNANLLTNFFLGISAILAMLAIALQTFLLMGKSTQDTVNSIFESSNRQIEKINNLVGKLGEANIILGSVSSSLKLVAGDVVAKQKMVPNLFLTFTNNQNQISLRTGEANIVEFYAHNSGSISATNADWVVLLPPQIKILDRMEFRGTAIQGVGTPYPNYNSAHVDVATLSAKSQSSYKIKIFVERTFVGLIEIPFKCSCTNAPQSQDKLLINFIG